MAENEDIMIEQTGEEQETETVTTEEAAPETTPETAVKTEKKPEKTPAKNRKNPFRSKKFKRGSLSVVFTVVRVVPLLFTRVSIVVTGVRVAEVREDCVDCVVCAGCLVCVDWLRVVCVVCVVCVPEERVDFEESVFLADSVVLVG